MDNTYSSGEDLVIKTRKPYTITKQRERWTEEEHNRFLEALKLYGRAWQRIEEYLGTKTAVQIRSHAQKFFTKLEKEAIVKGVPIGQAQDIEIPPPRPKRKPSNPYPRKSGLGKPSSLVGAKDGKSSSISSLSTGKQVPNLGGEPFPEKPSRDERAGNATDNNNENSYSEVLNLFQGPPCTSLSSANKSNMSTPRNSCSFRKFVPMGEAVCLNEKNKYHDSAEPEGNLKLVKLDSEKTVNYTGADNSSNMEMADPSLENLFQSGKIDKTTQPENCVEMSSNNMQATQKYPRHVPVHVLNASIGMNSQNVPAEMPYLEAIRNQLGVIHCHAGFSNPAASLNSQHIEASRSSSFIAPPYPLLNPFCNNQDDYQAYLQVASTFSSLIVSTLLQNPAAHAAASFAASFWPCANMEASSDSSLGNNFGRGFPSLGQIQPGPAHSPPPPPPPPPPLPSVSTIAAATVAAATAWWTVQGLLPFCGPPHPYPPQNGFNYSVPAAATPPVAAANNVSKRESALDELPLPSDQQLDQEWSEALQEQQQSPSKLPNLPSLDPDLRKGAKHNANLGAVVNNSKAAGAAGLLDFNKGKSKHVDPSSCGSNTPSSSEVETDVMEKHEKAIEEELKEEADINRAAGDSNNRRSRSSSSASDSWKEVSEEGRLAFQALFSREVLPQSFSPPHDMEIKGSNQQNKDGKDEDSLDLDLNSKTWGICSRHQVMESNNTSLRSGQENERVLLLTMDIGQGKLKAHRTGFKPYKRCSVEAKESMVGGSAGNQGEEKVPKRIRLEGEAST